MAWYGATMWRQWSGMVWQNVTVSVAVCGSNSVWHRRPLSVLENLFPDAALIAITAEQGVRAQLTQVELHMNQQLSMINFGQPRHKVAAEAEYDRLIMKQKTLMDSLSASAGKPLALLGGSVGNAISPPVVPPGIPPPAPRREKSPSTDELNKNKRAKTGDGVTDNDSDMRDASAKCFTSGVSGPSDVSDWNGARIKM
ncbi:hypothetical protein C8J57DRAFT_1679865 [Mycena rebaudengoi]|nr:hypothetical protein C8J57DRAFT_1679865 [Mycena rebaudengoi]